MEERKSPQREERQSDLGFRIDPSNIRDFGGMSKSSLHRLKKKLPSLKQLINDVGLNMASFV